MNELTTQDTLDQVTRHSRGCTYDPISHMSLAYIQSDIKRTYCVQCRLQHQRRQTAVPRMQLPDLQSCELAQLGGSDQMLTDNH